jgi:hypothetical protein
MVVRCIRRDRATMNVKRIDLIQRLKEKLASLSAVWPLKVIVLTRRTDFENVKLASNVHYIPQ